MIAAGVGVMLTISGIAPVHAGGGDAPESAVVGGFGLGDGLEATVEERVGAFTFTAPLCGGLRVSWDSRAAGDDRSGLGPAWDWGYGRVLVTGGVQVLPASGGVFPVDPTHPSGLAGYGVEDLVFEQAAGSLPGRTIEVPGPPETVGYAYVLHELGGVVTYFGASGDPVARVDRFGARTDWVWDEVVEHRLVALVDSDGMVTTIDWESEPGRVLVRAGANERAGEAAGGAVWRLELDGGRLTSVTDASGGRVSFAYDADSPALISGISAVSGGTTGIAWRSHDDGIPRVTTVTTTDATGAELSRREWSPGGDGALSSGWPHYAGESAAFWSGDPAFRYRTTLTDGSTRVVSEYNSQHLLVSRSTVGTSPSGEHVLQDQTLAYPGTEHGAVPDPAALPGNWSRPAGVTVTFRDRTGRERTATETFAFDARGRLTSRTDPDGTATETEYDQTVPAGARLPIGLPIAETTTGPDGATHATRHTLNAERTAVVATESLLGASRDDAVVTERTEYDVRGDGFVTARREFPDGDVLREPVITAADRAVDADRGEATTTETVAVGTPAEASTVEVASLVHHGVLARTDPLGNTERTTYDAIGQPVASRDAAGRVTAIEHETAQQHGRNAETSTGPDGVAVTEIRDELGRSIRTLDNVDRGVATPGHVRVSETRAYPEPGVTAVTDAWGATTVTRQDVFGREVETVAPSGLTQLTLHDDVANTVTTALTPTGRLGDAELVRVEHRDLQGRATGTSGRRADGVDVPLTSTVYDGLGRITAGRDGALDSRVEHDAFGRPATVASGEQLATRRFDGFGRSLEKTVAEREPDGDEAAGRSGGSRTLDALGRTATETDQAGRTTTYTYTPDGLLELVETGDGRRTQHTHDPVTRQPLTAVATGPAAEAVRSAFTVDPLTDRVTAVFDPADPVATTIAYRCDALGNRTAVAYPDGRTVTHEYDAHGRRVATTDVSGSTTRLTHTLDGLIERAVQTAADGRPVADVSYEYDAYRRVTTLRRGNGVVTSYTFTSASEIATETTVDAAGRRQSHRAYTYDPRGNLVRRIDTVVPLASGERGDHVDGRRGTYGEGAERSITTDYVYDAHDRLTRSTEREGDAGASTGAVTRDTAYELSATGDVLAETVTEAPGTASERASARAFEYGPRGELVARTSRGVSTDGPGEHGELPVRMDQAWDDTGNLLVGLDGTRYAYDAAGRPVTETARDGSVVATEYWADGSRRSLATTHPDGTTEVTGFYWDDDSLLNDTHAGHDAEARGVASYLMGSARQARTTITDDGIASTRYSGADRHGNVVEATDAGGDTVWQRRYADYGAPVGSTTDPPGAELERDPFGYAGEYTDATGRQHLREREYDPGTMQFTTRDDADRHNRYAYADLNPIMNVDPTGRTSAPDGWHQAIIGLGILLTVVIGVASAAATVATLGTLGVVIAVAGGLANAYSVALGIGALLAASDAATSIVDERAKEFLTSDGAWLSELAVGIGLAAASYLVAKATACVAVRAGSRRLSMEMIEFGAGGDSPVSAPSDLVTAWAHQVPLATSSGPLTLTTKQFDQLLVRTRAALATEIDPLASVHRGALFDGNRIVRGFRTWLALSRGVPLEVSARIYEYAGFGARSVAKQLRPHMDAVLKQSRLGGFADDGSAAIDYMQQKYDELRELVDQVNELTGRPVGLEMF